MDAKTKAIIAHIPYIGWIIALVINMSQKEFLYPANPGNLRGWFFDWFF
jgi:hypothetical protein